MKNLALRIKEIKESKRNTNQNQIEIIKQIKLEMEKQNLEFEYTIEKRSLYQDMQDSYNSHIITYYVNGNKRIIQNHKTTNIHLALLESLLEDLKKKENIK